MHQFDCFKVFQVAPTNYINIIATITTVIALGFAIYQSYLARVSLDKAKKAIDDEKLSRQLLMMPKMSWVIDAQVVIDRCLKNLKNTQGKTLEAIRKKDANILSSIVKQISQHPGEGNNSVDEFVFNNMPDSLREIMMSGMQYYHNAMAPAFYLWSEKEGANWNYAQKIQERFNESINALEKLRAFFVDMIPDVLLNTPASISDKDFIRK
ncbi:MAG: hypothetical protein WC349_02915 [Patescibacteria group bacterium]|jgi:hypothetical protein